MQTGTVATRLHNITLYNSGERGTVKQELIAATPTLIRVGLFNLFDTEEWITGDNPGRKFVGIPTKEYLNSILKLQILTGILIYLLRKPLFWVAFCFKKL